MIPGKGPRVLFVSYTAGWTGPSHSLLLLLTHLRARFGVSVLLPGQGLFSQILADEGIPVHQFRSLNKSAIPAILRLIRRERFDLVYGNNVSSSSKNALLASKLARVPFICHIRGMCRSSGWRENALLRFSDATIAVSASCAYAAMGMTGNRRPHIVYNGVSPASLEAVDRTTARAELLSFADLRDDTTVLISVGHVCPRKRQEEAVRAMAQIVERCPTARLLIVGALDRDRHYTEQVRALVRQLGLDGRVFLLGFRREVHRLLRGADLFVHTAVDDPHPRAVLEAMAAQLPVVAFAVDGVTETVLDGQTGRLTRVGDAEALAEAAIELIHDPETRVRFGVNGRERVAAHFSAEATARKVGDIIEQTISVQARQGRYVNRLVRQLRVLSRQ